MCRSCYHFGNVEFSKLAQNARIYLDGTVKVSHGETKIALDWVNWHAFVRFHSLLMTGRSDPTAAVLAQHIWMLKLQQFERAYWTVLGRPEQPSVLPDFSSPRYWEQFAQEVNCKGFQGVVNAWDEMYGPKAETTVSGSNFSVFGNGPGGVSDTRSKAFVNVGNKRNETSKGGWPVTSAPYRPESKREKKKSIEKTNETPRKIYGLVERQQPEIKKSKSQRKRLAKAKKERERKHQLYLEALK